MKKLFLVVMLSLGIASAAIAQPKEDKGGFDPMQSERIAYITNYVELTPEEAQAFWPIYNKIEAQQRELIKKEWKAYHELCKALNDGKGNVQALLDNYLAARKANVNLHTANGAEYLKVLSSEKVAKFYISEELFRRQQIKRLKGQHGGPGPEMGKSEGPHMDRGEGAPIGKGRAEQKKASGKAENK